MSIQDLTVIPREVCGKGETGRLRKQGLLPCVVYGMGGESVSVCAEPKAVTQILRSEKGLNTVLNLRMKDTEQTRHVMIKSVDRHPLNDRLMHVDFLRIDMDKAIRVTIPVHLTGTPEGAKLGGVLTIVRHQVDIICKPADVPASLTHDASDLGMDEALRIGDLTAPEGLEFVLGPTRVIAVVHAPESEAAVSEEDEEAEEVGV